MGINERREGWGGGGGVGGGSALQWYYRPTRSICSQTVEAKKQIKLTKIQDIQQSCTPRSHSSQPIEKTKIKIIRMEERASAQVSARQRTSLLISLYSMVTYTDLGLRQH